MPTYDVECSACGYEGTELIKLAELSAWDLDKKCPSCTNGLGAFRRVISHGSLIHSGAKAAARSEISRKQTIRENFVRSGDKDAMMHKNAKHHSPDKIAAARESVKKGEFEGF